MAQYTRIHVVQTILDQGLMPLFYSADLTQAKRVIEACYAGGGRLLEFTNRGDLAHEVFAELVKHAREHLPGMILGVGSVHDAGTAAMYMQCGANFIVSPVANDEVARVCNRRKVLWSPGCGTATEIAHAEELGAEIVKVFPGNALGPGFVSAVMGPTPWTSIMVTGGVSPTLENLKGWFDAGAVCVGMGSKLITKQLLASGEYDALEKNVREALSMIASLRS